MKWLTNRYAYPMVALAIIVSLVLQIIWLQQLYRDQRIVVKRDLEVLVGEATQMATYLGVAPANAETPSLRDFFLSPEWLQFFYAYNNLKFPHTTSEFNALKEGDTTVVKIRFGLMTTKTDRRSKEPPMWNAPTGGSLAEIIGFDKRDQLRVDSVMKKKFDVLVMPVKWHSIIEEYPANPLEMRVADDEASDSFYSRKYAYNFSFLNIYQVVVPSVGSLVAYRMRYYLLSSLVMMGLTIAVFFFILKLLRNQKLYSMARLSFTSNMTHELKTPVATVALALESIEVNNLENDPETLRSYLAISRSELKRLNLMIDKVLNLDQFDNGQTNLRAELFDIQQGLKDVITSMNLQISNAKALVELYMPEIPVFVSGDPVHLTNVFFNLIENALKYGQPGVLIEVSCLLYKNEIVISFKDNGPGIDAIYQKRVFDRFFRIPAASNDEHNTKGTGLGLNYVKYVIQQHGGKLKLESEKGKGCNFTIYLPVAS